jgi:hypothetical protein
MNLHPLLTSSGLDLSEADLAALPPEALQRFDAELKAATTILDQIRNRLDAALTRRYGAAATALRQEAGKDFGVVHLEDGPLRVTVELPKRVSWDQAQLGHIVRQIEASGDDPDDFVERTYKVSETRFSAWPAAIQAVFAKARTVKPGKPSFRLALMGGGDE